MAKAKKYLVTIAEAFSYQIQVSAKDKKEASAKAWEKFCKKKPNKTAHHIFPNEL